MIDIYNDDDNNKGIIKLSRMTSIPGDIGCRHIHDPGEKGLPKIK
jgi:hypothetical protein